ncbi:hypothetical protein [Pacificibacter marinus]|uniref:Uncharacterized protein n=1 Tax=Pacificibacter marinus TaxID=658057 RepID=A0A1Y5RG04_9RHOB|nr:hypothetical protein [Pacificibacter marinus]SEK24536.1 hypothetical protein SAMN04488032_101449 [Pacificibacter marinus]SLN13810.1 hypothetical protein PAM7971_00198 [Pacificibacter marinus]
MTALSEYDRLEASALWRPEGETQRIEVVLSMGKATLIISDTNDKTLSHWSLPAIERVNGTNERLAIYAPSLDTDERLETEDETMIAAILRIQRAIERGTPRPGRLRGGILAAACIGALALGVFWLPGALVSQAVTIVPGVTRTQIGEALLTRIERLSGKPCDTVHGARALQALKSRLLASGVGDIIVLRSGVNSTQHLPGGVILLNRSIIEDYEDPDVVAGYILAEQQRAAEVDPLEHLLRSAGFMTSMRLLTSGKIPKDTLDTYAEDLLRQAPAPVDIDLLIERFAAAEVRPLPYAYAKDITGVTTLPLIEADAIRLQSARRVLADGDWVALQDICGT